MALISDNAFLFLFICICVILLTIYFIFSYHKLKTTELNRLQGIVSEIEVEKKNKRSLKNTATEVEKIQNFTNSKLLKIKVEVLNIDFSYKEVLLKLSS